MEWHNRSWWSIAAYVLALRGILNGCIAFSGRKMHISGEYILISLLTTLRMLDLFFPSYGLVLDHN